MFPKSLEVLKKTFKCIHKGDFVALHGPRLYVFGDYTWS